MRRAQKRYVPLPAVKVNKHGHREHQFSIHDDYLLHLAATASCIAVKMPPPAEATLPATRRSRRSIGSHTDVRKATDKENATVDVGSSLAASRKKSRSKSMGPGGLDALKQGTGNRRAV